MKKTPLSLLGFLFCWNAALVSQETVPYELEASKEFDLVGVPLQRPVLGSLRILALDHGQIASWQSVSDLQPFSLSLLKDRECYGEVVGPTNHPALGHRLEIDEISSLIAKGGRVVFQTSTLNTMSPALALLPGTEVSVREHIDLTLLFGTTIRNQVLLGGQRAEGYCFYLNRGTGADILFLTTFLSPQGLLRWVGPDGKFQKREFTTIPLGSALGLKFGSFRGPALGFTGEQRTTGLPLPLQKGWNLLSYPFPRDLRLCIDWGGLQSGIRGGPTPLDADRLQIHEGSRNAIYALEVPAGGQAPRWRQIHSGRKDQWKTPATYLDVLPVGQGFLLWKGSDAPNHRFDPPKP